MSKSIRKILIANRGEIAVRVMRACRDLGIKSVAVYSDCDATAFHVRLADEARHIGGSPSAESYLAQDKIIEAAQDTGADAIHPGYGFLSENAEFAELCSQRGIIFIGPDSATIRLLGDKLAARSTAVETGLPVLPGIELEEQDVARGLEMAAAIGFPVLIKAAAGGGGKGMRVVEEAPMFEASLASAGREALAAFGDGRLFLEKFLPAPRHIEIQILCDRHGNAIHLAERECSVQRRHQKVIEEAPSPVMTTELRERMGEAAIKIAKATNYVGAGTVEFLVDEDMSFYFLEVNTRLQVEHPVTEMITGIDLVREQIRVAAGLPLAYRQSDIELRGHALECRIYAEDPEADFMPSTGTLKNYRMPSGPGIRVDSGVVIFSEIPVYYDPMIAKLVVWGSDRNEAIARARRALEEFRISGVQTTIGFHRAVLANSRFQKGRLSTRFLPEEFPHNRYQQISDKDAHQAAIAVAIDQHERERQVAAGLVKRSEANQSRWQAVHRQQALKPFGGNR